MPIAWLIASNGKAETINYHLKHLLRLNPHIIPNKFMSDNDLAQLGCIRFRYPLSDLFLCWWHVLHAWQRHFVISHYPELWEKLKNWIRITDEAEFWRSWEEIKELAPDSVIEYLQKNYLTSETLQMWSAVCHKDRTAFELCDTNMLVEAYKFPPLAPNNADQTTFRWHHILKMFHMDGKHNRRVDQLIHTLLNVTLPHYIANHRAQQFGFNGPDLVLKAQNSIHKQATKITSDMIEEIEPERRFVVKSKSTPGLLYTVDLEAYTCTPCPSFPAILFCKHVCAIENHFPDLVVLCSLPITSQPWDILPTDQRPASTSAAPLACATAPAVGQEDNLLLHYIVNKLQFIQYSQVSLPEPLITSLRVLNHALTDATNGAEVLPRLMKIAPNQGTRNETTEVMGVRRKGGKKRKNTDGYCGSESSGKLARPDAHSSKKAKTAQTPEPASSKNSVLACPPSPGDVDTGFRGFDDPGPVDNSSLPTAGAEESPEMLLRRSLALYNSMFPPDVPQGTSYYRENMYATPSSYYR
ncbi:hypothetical protein DFH07DRAFT_958758 [Mycena maculata]|uniref:SWIM-type domain-containing protein n=1 Tax=Mycena maculata TaxID=230809 RepID=A0AAD7NF94_9AGAR|nr:hypothetical protein DFH07DRAFT_958758 [Mycena maculata]